MSKISNVIGTVSLGCTLTLQTLAEKLRNAEYNPKRFSGVIIRIREPRTTGLVFASGTIMVTGAKSSQDCKLAGRKFARSIQKLGFPVRFQSFRVCNVVGHYDCGFPVDIQKLYGSAHKDFIDAFVPEVFPGLIYRMQEPSVTLMIFRSGKIGVVGGKVLSQFLPLVQRRHIQGGT